MRTYGGWQLADMTETSRKVTITEGRLRFPTRTSFFYPSEGRDTTLLKTPTRSASSSAAATVPLLPPIELQPPSPPRTVTTSHVQRRSRAYTTNEVVEGLELEVFVVTLYFFVFGIFHTYFVT